MDCYIKKIIYLSVLFILLALIFVVCAEAEEVEILKPTLDVKEVKPSSDYFGPEIKWSRKKDMGSDISAKIVYMDPEVFLSFVKYESNVKNWSPQKQEGEKKEILNLLNDYLIFKIFINQVKKYGKTDYINNIDWHICLIDDLGNKYFPVKIEKEKVDLISSHFGPCYQQICYLYFSKYNIFSGNEPILAEKTRWMKIELSSNQTKATEFKWDFFRSDKEKRDSIDYMYLIKIFILILLISLILLFWISRPYYN